MNILKPTGTLLNGSTHSIRHAPSRLEAVGMGERGLLPAMPPQTAEPRNQQVQVLNLGA